MKPVEAAFTGQNGKDVAREDYTIFSVVTLAYTGFTASFPFIAVFLLQVRDVPVSEVGIVYLVSGILGIAGQVIGGKLSDLIGTKSVLSFGLVGSVVIYSLMSIFVEQNTPIIAFLAAYPVLNVFNGLTQLALSSHISDRGKDTMASGMSLLYSGLNFGFTLGPISGGVLIDLYGYFSIFLFGAVVSLMALCAALILIKSNPRFALRGKPRANKKPLGKRIETRLIPFFALVFLSWLVISYQAVPLSVFESTYMSFSSIEIGIVLTTNGLLITLLQVPISRIIGIEKKLRLFPMAIGSVIMTLGFVAIANSTGILALEFAIFLTTLGEMMIAVPTQVVVTLFSDRHNRGMYQGLYLAFSRTGASLSPYLGPLSFAMFVAGPARGWYLIAAVSLFTGIGYFMLSSRMQRAHSSILVDTT